MTPKARPSPITEADRQAAARLKAHWLRLPNRPTQQALADAWPFSDTEANQSLISQYMGGKIALNHRAVLFFADQLGIAPEDIRNDLPEQRITGVYRVGEGHAEYDWTDIRAFAQSVGMGNGPEADEYAEAHKLKFRADSLARKRLRPNHLCVMYATGDSMLPRIHQGDAVLFDTSDTRPQDGKIFVLSVPGAKAIEYTAKRCEIIDDMVFFKADNPDGDHGWKKPKRMDNKRHPITIIGRVRWFGSWED